MTRHQTRQSIVAATAIALSAFSWLGASHPARADSPVLHAPPIPFTWQLSATDEARLYEQVKTLRYGDLLALVEALLGAPTLDEDIADKKGDHRAREVLYAIRRVWPEGGNVYDQQIALIFDPDSHRLLQIWYENMPPLSGDVIQTIYEPRTTEIIAYFTKPPMP